MTITIGWWAIPLLITAVGIVWLCMPSNYAYSPAHAVIEAFTGVIVILAAWLIYFAGLAVFS